MLNARFAARRLDASGGATRPRRAADRFRAEKRFFGFSILYLTLHFALLLAEAALRALGLAPAGWPVLF